MYFLSEVDRATQVTSLMPWSIIVLEQLLPTTALRINRVATGYTIIDIFGQFCNHVLPTIFFFRNKRKARVKRTIPSKKQSTKQRQNEFFSV